MYISVSLVTALPVCLPACLRASAASPVAHSRVAAEGSLVPPLSFTCFLLFWFCSIFSLSYGEAERQVELSFGIHSTVAGDSTGPRWQLVTQSRLATWWQTLLCLPGVQWREARVGSRSLAIPCTPACCAPLTVRFHAHELFLFICQLKWCLS